MESFRVSFPDDFQRFYNNKYIRIMTPPKNLKTVNKSKSFVWYYSFTAVIYEKYSLNSLSGISITYPS